MSRTVAKFLTGVVVALVAFLSSQGTASASCDDMHWVLPGCSAAL